MHASYIMHLPGRGQSSQSSSAAAATATAAVPAANTPAALLELLLGARTGDACTGGGWEAAAAATASPNNVALSTTAVGAPGTTMGDSARVLFSMVMSNPGIVDFPRGPVGSAPGRAGVSRAVEADRGLLGSRAEAGHES